MGVQKAILVDAIYCFVSDEGKIFSEMYSLLETYNNPKILLTGANDEQFKRWNLAQMPYPVFTCKHNPEKTNPEYYKKMLAEFGLHPENVIYFEHDPNAVASAQSIGITSYHYNDTAKDLVLLKQFLDKHI